MADLLRFSMFSPFPVFGVLGQPCIVIGGFGVFFVGKP